MTLFFFFNNMNNISRLIKYHNMYIHKKMFVLILSVNKRKTKKNPRQQRNCKYISIKAYWQHAMMKKNIHTSRHNRIHVYYNTEPLFRSLIKFYFSFFLSGDH